MMVLTVILLVVFGIADAAITYVALKDPATTEVNPVARLAMRWLGRTAGIVVLKLVATAIIVGVLLARPAWWPLGALFVLGYVWVLWKGVRVLRQSW